jgi:hypothetical protein
MRAADSTAAATRVSVLQFVIPIRPHLFLAICLQQFDRRYERQCQQTKLPSQVRFFYDIDSGACKSFDYGGCQFGNSMNFFNDEMVQLLRASNFKII